MHKILVTGASGFLARHLIPALRENNHEVSAIGRSERPSWLADCDYRRVDATDQLQLETHFESFAPDVLIHLSAQVRGTAGQLIRANAISAANVLAAARRFEPGCRLILFGSAAEYGSLPATMQPVTEATACSPDGAYGISKLTATQMALEAVRSWNAKVDIVRPFNIVGAHMPEHLLGGALIERLHGIVTAKTQGLLRVGRIDTSRDFVAVEDVVRSVLQLLHFHASGEVFNICSGVAVPIEQVLRTLLRMIPQGVEWQTDPQLVRPDDVLVSYGSFDKAREKLGFHPEVSLEDALRSAWLARMGR